VTTGRQLIHAALREPMRAIGWTPRAAGWFTAPLAPVHTGVIAAGAASEHAAPGTAYTTLFVHLRREDVEPVVRELVGRTHADGGYRSVTATTSIGCLMPEPTWRTWLVTPDTADAVAVELAAATRDHARPYLDRLAADPELLLAEVQLSGRMASAVGPCQVAVLLARLGRPEEGRAFVEERVAALGSRRDPAADHLREAADRLRHWLDAQ
jgi:hypothetical protein